MTKMWPSVYDPQKVEDSPGEKIIFDRLRNNIECEDWYVFYSFFLDDHQSQQEGEIDFLVFIPKKGFVVVEVKSHLNIEYKNRQWYMGKTIEARGPLDQANGNKWSFHKSVAASEKAPPEWNKIPRTHVAIFPRARFRYEGLEFDIINLYKIHMLERLSNEYDNVLYLDLDVVPNTSENFFEMFDMNKLCVYAPNADMESWSQKDRKNYKKGKVSFETIISHKDKYSEYVKAMCKRAMLALDNMFDSNYLIANTAILGGNSKAINNLKYSDRLKDLINTLNKAKEEKLFGEEISKLFFANNEIFFHYLLDKYNIDWFNLPKEWHTYLMTKDKITKDLKSAKMIHLINKRFEELWQVLDV